MFYLAGGHGGLQAREGIDAAFLVEAGFHAVAVTGPGEGLLRLVFLPDEVHGDLFGGGGDDSEGVALFFGKGGDIRDGAAIRVKDLPGDFRGAHAANDGGLLIGG